MTNCRFRSKLRCSWMYEDMSFRLRRAILYSWRKSHTSLRLGRNSSSFCKWEGEQVLFLNFFGKVKNLKQRVTSCACCSLVNHFNSIVRFVPNKVRAEALENYIVVGKRSETFHEKLRTFSWPKEYFLRRRFNAHNILYEPQVKSQ